MVRRPVLSWGPGVARLLRRREDPVSWVVVGLGNPGPKYEGNRHNAGRMVLDELARRAGAGFTTHRSRAKVADVRLGTAPGGAPGPRVLLAHSTGYMNVTGGPVASLLGYHRVDPERLIVVHDELDLDLGTVRLKRGGGEGGHNGLRSISAALGTKDYVRVRVGIGRPPGRQDPADYVLSDFAPRQRVEVELLIADGADAVEGLVHEGLTAVQNRFHARS